MTRRGTAARSALTAAAALLLAGGTALGALRIGTDGADTLVGTNAADQLTGKGGNDALKGLAGNDTYYFSDRVAGGWGNDTLEERPTYKVGTKKLPGGVDTVSFAQVSGTYTDVSLIPQWPGYNWAGSRLGIVDLGASVVENAVGSSSSGDNDFISGGGAANTLDTGGGKDDYLFDYGGCNAFGPTQPALPDSNDVFKGGAATPATST